MIQKTVLGGLASLIFGGYVALGDDTKTEKANPVDREAQTNELNEKVLKQIEELGLDAAIQQQIESALKGGLRGKSSTVSKTKTLMVGPDGKMKEMELKGGGSLDLETLLNGEGQEELKKLFEKHGEAVISGKVVVVDEDGNVTEKELQDGEGLNALIQEAFKGIDLADLDLNAEIDGAQVLGIGSAFLGGAAPKVEKLEADLGEMREELKAHRQLLEQILKKLN